MSDELTIKTELIETRKDNIVLELEIKRKDKIIAELIEEAKAEEGRNIRLEEALEYIVQADLRGLNSVHQVAKQALQEGEKDATD